MKAYLALITACLSLQGVSAANARPTGHARQRAAITAVLKSYEKALDAGDVEGVARLYTDDAVVLAPNAPSAVGIGAVRTAYTSIFQTIDLDLTFKIAELTIVSRNWAFLRSASSGVVTVLASGAQVPSSNQELFVVHKTRGRWKLARYSFSSTLPPA
ncbi:MAG TPA: SgcJ/EcaC family oxidoreductase [Thermoleophilaceae bacterium]|jgi:uncharacterized protein (TIGR02246 family)|nr:SgcJ/EcaC family oxidoreductase [Thermoleophilaceae bacterium]